MTFKNILTGIMIFVFLMLSSCAVYTGYEPGHPYDHSYYNGFYYDHDRYYDHGYNFDYDRPYDYDYHRNYDHHRDYEGDHDHGHRD